MTCALKFAFLLYTFDIGFSLKPSKYPSDEDDRITKLTVNLNEKLAKYILRLENLENLVKEQSETIANQQKELVTLRHDVHECSSYITSWSKGQKLETTIGAFTKHSKESNYEEFDQHGEKRDDTHYLDVRSTTSDQIRLLQLGSVTTVAFYTYMSKAELGLSRHHTLVFDTVKLNAGNGYSSNTGVFTAPSSGIYLFTWTLSYFINTQACTDIIINGNIYGNTFVQSGNTHEMSTGIVIAEVEIASEVYLRITEQPECNPYGHIESDSYRKSSFSGFRIGG